MVVSRRDDAISEVIGFVLILALIAIIASLYLTYVVPAQGRDLEIAHMDAIQNQFLDYKSTVDSLWINNQYNTQISSPFTLGTNPGSTQGSFVNMPLFQPVTSGGTMVVTDRDTINVTAYALYDESPRNYTPSPLVQIEPDNLFVNFQTSNISKASSVFIIPSGGSWKAQLNTIPGPPTALTITILKNGTTTVNNLTIQNSIANGQFYQVNLADSTYGIKESFVYPFSLSFQPNDNTVTNMPVGYYEKTGLIIPTTKMGSLEYHSSNNYWITQNYIYQYGGVFLQQDNGAVVKLLPSITIKKDLANPSLTRVTINNITISKTVPSIVGGSSLVEVLTYLQQPTINLNNLVNPQSSGVPNAKYVTITVTADDRSNDDAVAKMWQSTFEKIMQNSGYSPGWILVSRGTGVSGNIVTMNIGSVSGPYNIVLDVPSSVATISLSPTSY